MNDTILILDFGSQVTQLIARRVRESGVYCEVIPFAKGVEALTRLKPKGVILSGGPDSVYDDETPRAPEAVFALGVPVLGICLGAQLMAKTLGAKVYKNKVREIGWAPVYFTDAAKGDPVFGGLESPTTFCHWHGETFDMPAGAEWLAYSDNCRNQAFRYGKNAYGIQFHPEITPEKVQRTLEQAVAPVRDRHPGLIVTCDALMGWAPAVVSDAAEFADLLVVGRRGRLEVREGEGGGAFGDTVRVVRSGSRWPNQTPRLEPTRIVTTLMSVPAPTIRPPSTQRPRSPERV